MADAKCIAVVDSATLEDAEKAMWGFATEALSYVDLVNESSDGNALVCGLITRLCDQLFEVDRLRLLASAGVS